MVAALNRAFADVEYATWTQCEPLLAHAQVAAQLIAEHELISADAARLLHQMARYLYERARFTQAEPLYKTALLLREHVFGPEHPDVAQTLSALAEAEQREARKEAQLRAAIERERDARGPQGGVTNTLRRQTEIMTNIVQAKLAPKQSRGMRR